MDTASAGAPDAHGQRLNGAGRFGDVDQVWVPAGILQACARQGFFEFLTGTARRLQTKIDRFGQAAAAELDLLDTQGQVSAKEAMNLTRLEQQAYLNLIDNHRLGFNRDRCSTAFFAAQEGIFGQKKAAKETKQAEGIYPAL